MGGKGDIILRVKPSEDIYGGISWGEEEGQEFVGMVGSITRATEIIIGEGSVGRVILKGMPGLNGEKNTLQLDMDLGPNDEAVTVTNFDKTATYGNGKVIATATIQVGAPKITGNIGSIRVV